MLKSRIIRGKRLTTLSIGTIRTFITDSCKFVVILSRYSTCAIMGVSEIKEAIGEELSITEEAGTEANVVEEKKD